MVRYSIIFLIVVCYLIPFYQKYHTPPSAVMFRERAVPGSGEKKQLLDVSPFYREGFVNGPAADTISHVSSITPAGDNKMACTWYSGSREGDRDVSIYFALYDENQGSWSRPTVLVSREQASGELGRYIKKLGNPLIFTDKSGRLWLFYASVTVGGWSGTTLNYKVSSDSGLTWTESRKMILSPFLNLASNVKNKGINLGDGSFLLPVYHEFIKKYSQVVRVRPEDDRADYEIRKMTHEGMAIQPSLVYAEGNRLNAFFRNMGDGEENHVLSASSDDNGRSWSGLADTSLPNPDSGLDMMRLDSGAYLGVINDSYQDRDNLTMVISRDNGLTWKTLKVLENTYGKEFSYPSINRSRQGLYHLTYTYNRERIRHVTFNEAWIGQQTAGGSQ